MVFHDRVEQHISSSEESRACFSQKKAFSLDTINFSITRSINVTHGSLWQSLGIT